MPNPLATVISSALHGEQARLAEVNGQARRYRAAVAPFASLDKNTEQALYDLRALVAVGEAVFVLGEKPPEVLGFEYGGAISLLQMVFPLSKLMPEQRDGVAIEELTCANTAEMMELIAVAFPGYFREETCRMGRYFGIREGGRLIAMGGERMVFEADGVRWREMSALATHPDHTGRGLGTALMQHVVAMQRGMGAVSFLHVIAANVGAIRLYEKFGFDTVRRIDLHKLVRT